MCDEGFAGEACSRAVPNVCAHNCAGHGACLTNGVCACDAGFYGIGCTLAVAGHQCPRHCSGMACADRMASASASRDSEAQRVSA